MILSGLKAVFVTFPVWLATNIMSALKAVFVTFPIWAGGMILSGLKAVFIKLPGMIWEGIKGIGKWIKDTITQGLYVFTHMGTWIKEGLASLTDNEWVGPIFSVLSESFNALYEGWMAIYKPLKDAFDEIYQIFADIGTFWSDVMNEVYKELQSIIDPIAKFFSSIFGSTFDWTFLGAVMSGLQIVVHVLAQGIAKLLWPIKMLAKFVGFLLKVIAGAVKIIAKFVTGIFNVIKGLLTFDGNAISKGIGMIKEAIWMIGTWLYDSTIGEMIGFGTWLYDNTIGAMIGFGTWLYDSTIGEMIGFGTWLYDNTIGAMIGFGTWLYDNTIGAIIDSIPDWVKNLVGGASSIITDPIGAVKSGASKVGGMAYDAGAYLGGKARDAGAAVLNTLNPFNYFEEGTKNVKQPGLAVLHAGEMVVPKSQVKSMTAVGDGPFGSASAINKGAFESGQGREAVNMGWSQKSTEIMAGKDEVKTVSGISRSATSTDKEKEIIGSTLVGVAERLIQSLDRVSDSKTQSASGGVGLGLFDPVKIMDAMDSGVTMLTSAMVNPVGAMESAFKAINPFGGEETIYSKLINAFTNKSNSEKTEGRGVADAGDSMYYSDIMGSIMQNPIVGMVEALKQTVTGNIVKKPYGEGKASTNLMDYSDSTKGQTSTNLMDYSDSTKGQTSTNLMDHSDSNKGQTSTNLMDYSDSIKGTVSPTMIGMMDAESRVAQEKYGSNPSGSTIPGMDGIEAYLAQEQNMMKVMIDYLAKIETNTSKVASSGSNVIGPVSNGLPTEGGKKMRRISQEQISGEWDLTFGDYSPTATTNY